MLFGVLKEEDFTPLPSGRQACLQTARCGKACAPSRRPTNATPAVALMPSCSSMRKGGGKVRRPVSLLGHNGTGFNIKSSTNTHTHPLFHTHTAANKQQPQTRATTTRTMSAQKRGTPESGRKTRRKKARRFDSRPNELFLRRRCRCRLLLLLLLLRAASVEIDTRCCSCFHGFRIHGSGPGSREYQFQELEGSLTLVVLYTYTQPLGLSPCAHPPSSPLPFLPPSPPLPPSLSVSLPLDRERYDAFITQTYPANRTKFGERKDAAFPAAISRGDGEHLRAFGVLHLGVSFGGELPTSQLPVPPAGVAGEAQDSPFPGTWSTMPARAG